MLISNLKNFPTGWFIGAFNPSLKFTQHFEVAIHKHEKGYIGPKHYHKLSTEYNYIVSGRLRIKQSEVRFLELREGDFFVFQPEEIGDVEFVEDTVLVVVRDGSNPGDK